MNHLIGVEYKWGSKPGDGEGFTDCFQLCCEVRHLLGMFNFSNNSKASFTSSSVYISPSKVKRLSSPFQFSIKSCANSFVMVSLCFGV